MMALKANVGISCEPPRIDIKATCTVQVVLTLSWNMMQVMHITL